MSHVITFNYYVHSQLEKSVITKKDLLGLYKLCKCDDRQMSFFLDVSLRGLREYKTGIRKIPRTIQERILALYFLYKTARMVFGSIQLFNTWLRNKNDDFLEIEPFYFMDLYTGVQLIYEHLLKMTKEKWT